MLLLVAVVFSALPAAVPYKAGPPVSVCVSMVPDHTPHPAQTEISPYNITVDKTSYMPNDVIQVTIQSCGSKEFEGFMLEARRADSDLDRDEAIGTFNALTGTQRLTCGSVNAAVAHSNSDERSSLTFTWTAPAASAGHIVFTATFVEDFEKYWVKVFSDVVKDSSVATAVKPGTLVYPSPCKGNLGTSLSPLLMFVALLYVCIFS